MTTATLFTIILVVSAGICELAAAYIALRGLRRLSQRVPELLAPGHPIIEALATTPQGVNPLLLDRVVRALLAEWSAKGSSLIAVTFLVPLGIVLGTVGDVVGALK